MSEEEKDKLDEQQDQPDTETEQQDDPTQDGAEPEAGEQPAAESDTDQPAPGPEPTAAQEPAGDDPEQSDDEDVDGAEDEAELELTDERDEPQKLAYLRASLTRYSRVMGPGGQAVAQGNGKREQENLYRTLITALMLPEDLFEDGVELVLAFFREYRNAAFREQMLHRFVNELSLREQQVKAYRGLVTLFSAAADPQMRGHALTRMVDIEKLVDRMPNNEVAARLLAYFDAD